MPQFKIGCGSLTWPREMHPEQVLSEIAQAGYAGVPIGPRPGVTPEQIAAELAAHGLVPAPGYLGAEFWDVAREAEILERARALAVAMMEEVEVMTRAPLVLRDLQDTLRKCRAGEEIPADVMARADQLLGQALTVDSRAGTLKTLSETLIKVVAIERDTFHIDGGGDKPAGADASVLAGAMSAHAQRMEQAFAKATAAITAGAHAE